MNHSKTHSKASAGFTLVEVMIAGLVMAAGVMGMIQVVSAGAQMVDTARKQAVAMQIIDSEMEKLRSADSASLNNLFGVSSDTASYNASYPTRLTYAGSTPTNFKTID